jgi:hypothetical protein
LYVTKIVQVLKHLEGYVATMMQGYKEGDRHSAKKNIGTMGSKGEVQMLMSRSKLMYESLRKSQVLTDSIVNILGSFDRRLSSLEIDMRPMQVSIPILIPLCDL